MKDDFSGKGAPIDATGLQSALDLLALDAACLWSVIGVETSGHGFLADRRPVILFERHEFSARTGHRFDARNPDLSNPVAGGYGAGGAAQYDRLSRAIALDRKAALLSASWGLGQVMGYHADGLGFAGVEDMVAKMAGAENWQLTAMARFIAANDLAAALRSRDWARFARGYNGPAYRKNNYDTRRASEYARLDRGGLPDLAVRAAQTYLTYLGYDTRGIDGLMGRFTRAALNDFQSKAGMELSAPIDERTLDALSAAPAPDRRPSTIP